MWIWTKQYFLFVMLQRSCSLRLSLHYLGNSAFDMKSSEFAASIFATLEENEEIFNNNKRYAQIIESLNNMLSIISWVLIFPAILNIQCLRQALTKDTVTLAYPLIEASFNLFFLFLQLYPLSVPFNYHGVIPLMLARIVADEETAISRASWLWIW